MAEHIPGPWGIAKDTRDILIESDAWIIAEVWSLNEGMGRATMANAMLIAAAPELLRACHAALAYLADPPSKYKENRDEATRIIRDAIRKAVS